MLRLRTLVVVALIEGPDGWVQYDDMVVATGRIGCLVSP